MRTPATSSTPILPTGNSGKHPLVARTEECLQKVGLGKYLTVEMKVIGGILCVTLTGDFPKNYRSRFRTALRELNNERVDLYCPTFMREDEEGRDIVIVGRDLKADIDRCS